MSLKTILATAVALTLSAAAASAAVLDFAGYANGNEQGVANGDNRVIGGVTIEFNATGTNANATAAAYFDHGNAGLGVCSNWTATATVNDNECAPRSDDNLTSGETVTLSFASAINILAGTMFNDTDPHRPLTVLGKQLTYKINGGATQTTTFENFATLSFGGVNSITFGYGDYQYYVGQMTVVPVPLPAAGLMLLAGLGALGAARRRRG